MMRTDGRPRTFRHVGNPENFIKDELGTESMAESREDCVFLSKLAEQSERYDEMVQYMKQVAALNTELSVEERNLLSVAYKNVIGSRRASWRIITSLEQKELAKNQEKHVEIIKAYRATIESELAKYCDDVLKVIAENLLPNATTAESKVFYKKMEGDYYRSCPLPPDAQLLRRVHR